jgi:hypothetical protein
MHVAANEWASKKMREAGFETRSAYFVYRFRGGDGLTYDLPIACDYFTRSKATDGIERTLMFPCPVCEMRASKGLNAAGEMIQGWLDMMQNRDGYQAGRQLTVTNTKRDFDVADNLYIEIDGPNGKVRKHGLVAIAGRTRCPDCMDARDGRAFDIVFPKVGLAMPFSPLVGTIWTPTDADVMR